MACIWKMASHVPTQPLPKSQHSATGMLDQLTFMRSKREGGALGSRSALPAAARPSARQSTSSSDGFALCKAAARLLCPRVKVAALACTQAIHDCQRTCDCQASIAERPQSLCKPCNPHQVTCVLAAIAQYTSCATSQLRDEICCAPSGVCPLRSTLPLAQQTQPEPRAQAARCGQSRPP